MDNDIATYDCQHKNIDVGSFIYWQTISYEREISNAPHDNYA